MNDGIIDVRTIVVSNGNVLTIEMTQRFIDEVRKHIGLSIDQPLKDDHVRDYLLETVDRAVSKAEQGIRDEQPAATARNVRGPRRRKKGA